MTREELKAHCQRQIENCEMWARYKEEAPHGKVYEEHKLILELLEQETVSKEVYDHEYFLRKELEFKIDKLQRQLEEQAVKAEPILDKIRAEIEELKPNNPNFKGYFEQNVALNKVLEILDKYKAESEE